MSQDSVATPSGKSLRDGTGWRLTAWASLVLGAIALAQTLLIALLVFVLASFQGVPWWKALVMVGSPSAPLAFLAIVLGVVGLWSSLRRLAIWGIGLAVGSIVMVLILNFTSPL